MEGTRPRLLMLGTGLALALSTSPLHAQDEPAPSPAKPSAVTFSGSYDSDLNADVAGGERRGVAYLGKLIVQADLDLDRLVGLRSATVHVSVLDVHGTGASGHFVDNLATVSGIEAEPAVRLNQVWLEFPLTSGAQLRLGKIAAQEFFASPTAGLFINSSFGWPASFATNLPSGGPSWPLAAPGARLSAKLDSAVTARIAVFSGDPAGPGQGDPQRRDDHGFNAFGFAGQPFLIGEVSTALPGGATVTLGGWAHFERFEDIGGGPSHRGDYAVYGLVDAPLWKSAHVQGRSLSGFARASISPSDRNPVDFYLDGGLSLSAPFPKRSGDTAGIAFAYAHLSPRLAASGGAPVPPGELVAEASYRFAVGKRLSFQPNLQYVVHPAGFALDTPRGPATPDALVVGLRTSLSF